MAAAIGRDQSPRVLVDATNTGQRPGDEVVQLCIRDLVSSTARSVKELKSFERVSLQRASSQS